MCAHNGSTTASSHREWLRIKEAANYAGVSARTIRNWMDDGLVYRRLNHQFVRIHPNSIDDFLQRKHVDKDVTVAKKRVDNAVKGVLRKLPPNRKG